MKLPIVLFDADGVLTLPEEVFSIVYARSRGLDAARFEEFFRNEWRQIVTGKQDLKESIAGNPALWQWHGSVDELLELWFKTEDVRNAELLQLIRELRGQGTLCYLATDQEKYRGQYMRDVMFGGLFDGYYISADLGVTKTDPTFFTMIIEDLQGSYPEMQAQDIVFFDDSRSKIDTARSVGIDARLYTGVEHVRQTLAAVQSDDIQVPN